MYSRKHKLVYPRRLIQFVGSCRMSTQINELLQKGVDPAVVADAFCLDTNVVEEVQRVQATTLLIQICPHFFDRSTIWIYLGFIQGYLNNLIGKRTMNKPVVPKGWPKFFDFWSSSHAGEGAQLVRLGWGVWAVEDTGYVLNRFNMIQ